MSVGQKLVMLKFLSTSITFLNLRNLEAAPEEAMQLDVCSLANQRFSENCLLLSQPFWISDCLGHT